MASAKLTRRTTLAALAGGGLSLATQPVWAETPLILEWRDLVPEEEGETMDRLRQLGVVNHGQMSTGFEQQTQAQLTRDFDGRVVRLPGYMAPLDFDGTGVTSFLLVPYIGACIHVPPPPPNQLVFVTTEEPYAARGLFEPVIVTGVFGASATETQLAEVGYSIVADKVEAFR